VPEVPNKIITGYDGSDGGKVALEEAIKLSNEIGGDVTVLFAYEKVVVGGESHDLDEAVEAIGERVLADAVAIGRAAGAELTTEYIEGPAAQTLATVAEREGARYIVVGGSGEAPLKAWVLGSTANKLLALAPCPVVVVRVQ
jgi:nucleotide-binding universal stress UspA family protein